jgi:hypothetical protein
MLYSLLGMPRFYVYNYSDLPLNRCKLKNGRGVKNPVNPELYFSLGETINKIKSNTLLQSKKSSLEFTKHHNDLLITDTP